MVSQAELIWKGYHSLVPGLISIFLETVWVSLIWLAFQTLKFNLISCLTMHIFVDYSDKRALFQGPVVKPIL